ncbi:4253_t:CDS:2, partial [Paraglomus brasilianum]
MELGASMLDIVHFMDPGVILLVAGDGDYYPILTRALKYNWKIEVWFCSSGICDDLMKDSFLPLDSLYRHFTYAYGQDP